MNFKILFFLLILLQVGTANSQEVAIPDSSKMVLSFEVGKAAISFYTDTLQLHAASELDRFLTQHMDRFVSNKVFVLATKDVTIGAMMPYLTLLRKKKIRFAFLTPPSFRPKPKRPDDHTVI